MGSNPIHPTNFSYLIYPSIIAIIKIICREDISMMRWYIRDTLEEHLKDHLDVKNETLDVFLKRIIGEYKFDIDPDNLDGYEEIWPSNDLIKCERYHDYDHDGKWTLGVVFLNDNIFYVIDGNNRINYIDNKKIKGYYTVIILEHKG